MSLEEKMSDVLVTLKVSKSVYYDTLDEDSSGIAKEIGLPEPEFKKAGKGFTAVFADIPLEMARAVEEHLYTLADCWMNGSDDYYEEGYDVREAARRVTRDIKKQTEETC